MLDRLVYLRTVLEKLKPIESKLKYQIDKVRVCVLLRGGAHIALSVGFRWFRVCFASLHLPLHALILI